MGSRLRKKGNDYSSIAVPTRGRRSHQRGQQMQRCQFSVSLFVGEPFSLLQSLGSFDGEFFHSHKKLSSTEDRVGSQVESNTHTSAPMSSHRIDFIDEDQTRSMFFTLFKKITDTACSHTHKHFNEV